MPKKQTQWSKNFNNKTYKMLSVRLPIRLVDDFKAECLKRSVPQAQVIRQAVEEFLEVQTMNTRNFRDFYMVMKDFTVETERNTAFFYKYELLTAEDLKDWETYPDFHVDFLQKVSLLPNQWEWERGSRVAIPNACFFGGEETKEDVF